MSGVVDLDEPRGPPVVALELAEVGRRVVPRISSALEAHLIRRGPHDSLIIRAARQIGPALVVHRTALGLGRDFVPGVVVVLTPVVEHVALIVAGIIHRLAARLVAGVARCALAALGKAVLLITAAGRSAAAAVIRVAVITLRVRIAVVGMAILGSLLAPLAPLVERIRPRAPAAAVALRALLENLGVLPGDRGDRGRTIVGREQPDNERNQSERSAAANDVAEAAAARLLEAVVFGHAEVGHRRIENARRPHDLGLADRALGRRRSGRRRRLAVAIVPALLAHIVQGTLLGLAAGTLPVRSRGGEPDQVGALDARRRFGRRHRVPLFGAILLGRPALDAAHVATAVGVAARIAAPRILDEELLGRYDMPS